MSVLALLQTSDDRLWGRLLEWRPPRWFRLWMLAASRLGDGWTWLLSAVAVALGSDRVVPTLTAATAAATLANVGLLLVKARVRRPRPSVSALPAGGEVVPLEWFACDRFSFPSGHALNAFAAGSLVAWACPHLAVPALAVAASIAASRVVLGLHWLSDVLAGACTGAALGSAAWLLVARP